MTVVLPVICLVLRVTFYLLNPRARLETNWFIASYGFQTHVVGVKLKALLLPFHVIPMATSGPAYVIEVESTGCLFSNKNKICFKAQHNELTGLDLLAPDQVKYFHTIPPVVIPGFVQLSRVAAG
ncbi:hypothetical protein OUZ56_027576 [Daphnia magna]|uniref:Uncharacterized protein n=1 Tax=Daphnia magna TaxID=35525 RepID=A0ABR0B1K0_9CRUS|nr:hypothetical protein OUZ56_027576 [Daphnia magna]